MLILYGLWCIFLTCGYKKTTVFLPAPSGREQQRCSALGPPCVPGLQVPRFSPPRPCTGSAATGLLGHPTARCIILNSSDTLILLDIVYNYTEYHLTLSCRWRFWRKCSLTSSSVSFYEGKICHVRLIYYCYTLKWIAFVLICISQLTTFGKML